MTRALMVVVVALSGWVGSSAAAEAQVIGTFTWQTQPYCNRVTVTVVQQGPQYQLTGQDDRCGAGPAPVSGTAVPSGGDVKFGVSVALPDGRTAHLSATISLASLSGTWNDDAGASGTFAFGASAQGSPRPAPPSIAAPRLTRVLYSTVATSAGGDIFTPVKLRDLGTFTSQGGTLKLTWISHVTTIPSVGAVGGACAFQLRVNGQPSGAPAVANLVGDEAVLQSGDIRTYAPVSLATWFSSVGPGTHTLELWVRSVSATCGDNGGNYPRMVTVEEYGAP